MGYAPAAQGPDAGSGQTGGRHMALTWIMTEGETDQRREIGRDTAPALPRWETGVLATPIDGGDDDVDIDEAYFEGDEAFDEDDDYDATFDEFGDDEEFESEGQMDEESEEDEEL